jgi:hypothetical protein
MYSDVMSATTTKRVLCGNCKGYHASAADVKACYFGDTLVGQVEQSLRDHPEPSPMTEGVEEIFKNIAAGTSPEIRKSSDPVEPGHYAIESRTGNNDLDFFRVKAGKGKWAGRFFVDRIIGGHPEQGITWQEAKLVLAALERLGVEGRLRARVRYAQEIGSCYRCNRHLTDETSRQLGIGPECRKAE